MQDSKTHSSRRAFLKTSATLGALCAGGGLLVGYGDNKSADSTRQILFL